MQIVRPVIVTVVLQLMGKSMVFRNVPFDDAMKMVEGRKGYKLIFGEYFGV